MNSDASNVHSNEKRPSDRLQRLTRTVPGYLAAGIALILAIVLSVGWICYRNLTAALEAEALENHTYVVMGELGDLLSCLKDAETGQRGFIITGDLTYLEPYRASLTEIDRHLTALRHLTADNRRQQQRLAAVTPLVAAELAKLEEDRVLRETRGLTAASEAMTQDHGRKLMDELRTTVGEAQREEEQLLQDRVVAKEADTRRTIRWVVMGGTLGSLALLIMFISLRQEFGRRRRSEIELLAHQKELTSVVAVRTKELRESEWTARAVLDGLTAHIATVDERGFILAVNARWREFSNQNGASLLEACEGENYLAVCDNVARCGNPEADAVAAGIRDVLAGRRREFATEYSCHSPTEKRWFIVRVTPFLGDGPRRAVIAHEDITEGKLAEEALRQSETLLRAITDHSEDMIFVKDRDSRLLFMNPAGFRLNRLTPEQAFGRMDDEIHSDAKQAATFMEMDRRVMNSRRTETFEEEFFTPEGEQLTLLTSKTPRLDPQGNVVGVIGVSRDITERKRAEKALRQSEERYRTLFTTLIEGFCIIEVIFDAHERPVDYRFLEMNPAFEKQTGLHNAKGKLMRDLAPDHEAHWFEIYGRIAVTGEPARFENEARALNRWYDVSAFRFGGEESRKVAILFNDITESKRAETAARESEAKYRQLVQALPAAVYTCDAQGNITLYNAAAVKLWGREPQIGVDRWCGSHLIFTPDGERLPLERCPMALAVNRGELSRDAEILIERPDGSRAHVLAFPDPTCDSSGTVTGAVNMLVDITALKAAENALRTSERTLRTLSRAVEQSPAGVLITNPAGEIEYVNPTFLEMTGYSLKEVLGKNPRLLKSGVQPAGLFREMWETITAGRDWRSELCNRKKNGELFWVSAVIAPILDEDGTVTQFVELMEDITERKRTEKALAESKQRLAGIVGSAMDAIVSVDAGQRIVLFNAAAETMFRCAASEALGGPIERFIPKRFHAAHAAHIRRFSDTGTTSRVTGHMGAISGLRADGEEFPIEASISEVDVGGEKISTVILRDITERRRLEHDVLEISALEQQRIGQDLHDDLCQWLTATEFLASALAKDLGNDFPANAARAQKIATTMRQANARARTLAHGLVPTVIEEAGLTGALRELAADTSEMFHIRCFYDGPESVPIRDPSSALHLYRIVQEAISNAVRHGGAHEVHILLQPDENGVAMLIRDNGSGIPKPQPETQGMGLRTMRYRAGIIGAKLEIRPRASGGTEIACTFPKEL